MNNLLIECCANSIKSAVNGESGGAHRIELCRKLEIGGLTPLYKQIIQVKKIIKIPVHILIRPRPGNFIYSDRELAKMIDDITFCKQVSCEGVVVGTLNNDGSINKKQCEKMIEAADGMHITFHRAFDSGNNLKKNLKDVIACGFDTLLTAGQSEDVEGGFSNLEELVRLAKNRINILAGSGVNVTNIDPLYKIGIRHFHLSGSKITISGDRETSTEIIREVVKELTGFV